MTWDIFVALLAATVLAGTPLLYATMGELVTERSGVLNLGVEGMMIMGAFFAFIVQFKTGNPWLAALAAGDTLTVTGPCGNGFDAGEEGFPQRGHGCGRSPESVYGFRNLLFSEYEAGRREFYLLEMADFQKPRRRPRGIQPGFRRAGNALQGQGGKDVVERSDDGVPFQQRQGRIEAELRF